MVVLPRPPVISANEAKDLDLAHRIAERIDANQLSRHEGARRFGVDAMPFLTETEAGRRFLSATGPRAIARGMPQELCPVVSTVEAARGTRTADVAVEALRTCLAKLGPDRDQCGCRVIALDDLVTVPLDQTAYATGSSARMRVSALGIDLLLVAEDAPDGATLLRDLRGTVASLEYGSENAVKIRFQETGREFEGFRIAVGFRRGRVAERIYAVDGDGNRLSLLIGFEPDELARSAGAWLAWPSEG